MMISLCAKKSRNKLCKPARRRLSKDKRLAKRTVRRRDRQIIQVGGEPEAGYALTKMDIS